MNNKLIRGILIASVASMGLAIVLVVAQIALYMGAKPSMEPAASSRPASAPVAPAPAAAPETADEEPAAE